MGVKNLWDILDSCKQKLPLNHLQNKKVCVDLSCWLVQFCTANRSPAFVKDKVYLKNLFHRIRALLALNCSLIFVTDGAIPSIKLATYRRRLGSSSEANCDETSSQPLTSLRRNKSSEFSRMIKEAKHLGLALGIPCLDGVEEAEAQCALLNLTSVCEGCFTSDSDAFLFGARTVYRDVFIGDGGYVVCYEMEDIEKKLGFGRKSLISLALLLGCDYSNGVRGFGPEAACRLVKSAGDDSILDQILSDGVKATRKFKGKKVGINQNKAGTYAKKTNTSEVGMSQDSGGQFREVINAFLEPKCHSPDSENVQRVCCQHPFRRSEFQQICEKYFEWTPEKTDEYILPKIAERELRRFSNLRSTSSALGVKPMLNEIPVPCPVLAITKQRKVHGSEYYEVSWRNMYGLQTSVVPGDLIRSACPEKITEFLEKKDEEKKQKRKARPKKSAQQAEVKDVDARLQELLLGIESECATFPPASSCPQTADGHAVVPAMDVIDLSSPSPPLRACKSQKFIGSTTATMNGIDLQCQSLLTDMTESQSSTQSSGAQNLESQSSTQSSDAQYLESQSSTHSSDALKFTLDDDLIDLSSPLPLVADRPCSLQDLPPYDKAERRVLTDLSNFPEKSSMPGASDDRHKAGARDGCVPGKASPPVVHGAWVSSSQSNAQINSLAESEAGAIDLCSPSPAIVNRRRNVKLDKNVIDISEADGSVKSPEDDDHERKARELRLFLKSIRDEL
ncbi:hypothetical protein ACQ4PT_067348 [Festuca glaucescens]